MKKNKMWGILAGCIFCTALFPCTVKANNETQTIMNELVRASPGWDLNRIDSTLTFSQDDAVRLMKIAAAEGGEPRGIRTISDNASGIKQINL